MKNVKGCVGFIGDAKLGLDDVERFKSGSTRDLVESFATSTLFCIGFAAKLFGNKTAIDKVEYLAMCAGKQKTSNNLTLSCEK